MPYSSEVLADSPLAYYRLGESSGTTMVDSSGNARDGAYGTGATLGATSLLPAETDTAIDVSTTGTAPGTVASAVWMDVTTYSVEAWVTLDSTSDLQTILARYNGSSASQLMCMLRVDSGVLKFYRGRNTSFVSITGPTLVVGTKYHIVGTFDFATLTMKLYVDGVEVATGTGGTPQNTPAQPFTIGTNAANSERFDGRIDEVSFYGTALSGPRVLAHYNAGATTPPTLTLAGTTQRKTAAFVAATVLTASLAGAVQPKTAAFVVDIPAAPDRTIAMAGETQAKTATFQVLTPADAHLGGAVRTKVAAFNLLGSGLVALDGSVQAKTAAFDLETSKRLTIAASLRRKTSIVSLASNPAVRLAATLRSKTAAFVADAQPTITLAGTVAPKIATFTTYIVTPVTPAPIPAAGYSKVVARAFGPVTMQGSQAVYSVSSASIPRARQRILVDGVDISYWRDTITPNVSYTLMAPLLYGPATLDLPQVSACFERAGYGTLAFLHPGANVEVQRVLDDVVVGTDYKGVVVAFDTSGRNLSVELGGEVSGRAAIRDRQVPVFPRTNDLGHQVADAVRDLGLPFYPHLGPVTGIEVMTTGGTGHLEHIQALVAKAWTRAGKQWTVMPDPVTGVYEMHRKDTTTIDGTVFVDDAKTVANLRRDISEEPNRVFATGVTPKGQRVRFGVYPGLIQGPVPEFPGQMRMGDTGDGVRLLIGKLHAMGYLKLTETGGGYDQDVYDAVVDVQNDAGLFDDGFSTPASPGVVGIRTWGALYDLGVTGNSLEWAHIEPAAQRRKVRPWNRSGTGGIMGVNPLYDPSTLVRDRTVDMGVGLNRSQMREFARSILHDSDDANWVGDITFHTGALIRGDGFEGMTVTPADVMDARELRPGMNLDLPQFAGGVFVHISAIQVDGSGIVTATVDTRFRDAMEVWEVIARNAESRHDPARKRNAKHRSSTILKDSIGEWDEIGGLLGNDVTLDAGWNVFPVVAATEGTISRLRIILDTPAEFAVAVFGKAVDRGFLDNMVAKPLTRYGTRQWEKKADVLEDAGLLFSAGTKDEPCGYWPGRKTETVINEGTDEETTVVTNPPTGKVVDDAGFAYRSESRTLLHVAVWVRTENTIMAGRIMWPQLEAGA